MYYWIVQRCLLTLDDRPWSIMNAGNSMLLSRMSSRLLIYLFTTHAGLAGIKPYCFDVETLTSFD